MLHFLESMLRLKYSQNTVYNYFAVGIIIVSKHLCSILFFKCSKFRNRKGFVVGSR